ncbi:helix-turn-helix domain-containing protein [Sinorhizobium meliloti]|uniref:recombinase family protein n=1 Tax=Rhizobium meliloti TaxID=382 RepID=UPI001295CA9A|nr:recombinase family protein [Sinorhizobium meliloti]MQW40782.1 helix-turn-helix domain-containing protein [Sinorhizobium meliloti]
MIYGYARVSTTDQTTDLQDRALSAAGCGRVFRDHGTSGAKKKRPGLDSALAALQPGDVLTVWRLDRLGRNLSDLIAIVQEIEARGAAFRSLSEQIDTTTPTGRLFFHMAGAFAEFERSLIIERTKAGLTAAKGRGVRLGRRLSLTPDQIRKARLLIEAGEGPRSVAASFDVSESTLYRAFQRTGI